MTNVRIGSTSCSLPDVRRAPYHRKIGLRYRDVGDLAWLMRTESSDIDAAELAAVVEGEWGVGGVARFLPVGGDSWSYRIGELFVNVRDRFGQRKAWAQRVDVRPAFAYAMALRDHGLEFLLAPTATNTGSPMVEWEGFAVTAFPFLDGDVRYEPYERFELEQVATWIARLHAATADVTDIAGLPHETFEVDFADALVAGLERACAPTDVGPYSESLRRLVPSKRDTVLADLRRYQDLADQLRRRTYTPVVTHGEPFPGNVFRARSGADLLIDLGELTLAPPERDLAYLRMLAGPDDRDVPARTYGRDIDEEFAEFYLRRWGLAEITEYVDQLSRAHTGDAEDRFAWTELTSYYLVPD